jgi:aminoglycoside 6'-N-acetyltransferase
MTPGSLCEQPRLLFASPPPDDSAEAPPTSVTLPQVRLRNATLDDLQLLMLWDEADHVQVCSGDPDCNDWNWEYELPRKDLSWRYQLIAEDLEANNKPIGFLQIIDPFEEESHYWGLDCEPNQRAIDIWIGEENYLNRGFGTQMMKQVLAHPFVFGHPNVTTAWIDPLDSNTKAHRFYQRLGFQPIGIRYFNADRCLVHRLTRSDYLSQYRWKFGYN